MKKTLLLVLVLCLCLSGFAGATAPATAMPLEEGTYLFETEYTFMEDVIGGGISGAAAGLNMIMENADASNMFYVGSTHSENCVITYAIHSDVDTTATLRLLLGNELSAMKLNPATFIVSVNGVPFEYAEFELPAEVKPVGRTFTQFNLGDISLVAGENIITFQIGPNQYCNGTSGGPLLDAMKLTAPAAQLTMTEYPENIE